MAPTVHFGLEVCCQSPPDLLRCSRGFGLLSNQASVDASFRHAADALHTRFPGKLKALFGPQHGLWSGEQDDMVETPHGMHERLAVPVHSLYSETRKPTQQMLEGLDLLVVDLQDVGTRVYTYVWTLTLCLEACAQKGIPVLVLDRPNPLGGEVAEGPLLDPDHRSFVGRAAIPMRHGLTLGELASFCKADLGVAGEVQTVPMQGWRRSMLWPDTGRAWVPPSPNLPRWEGALVYPGQVLLEGTNLSEGRGTTTPFEQFGAPFLDPWQVQAVLAAKGCKGVALRPVRFEPTFHKWQAETCGGLFLHVTDAIAFEPYRTTLALLRAVHELWPQQFAWRPPPYEYEAEKMPIDILTGGPTVRTFIDRNRPWAELDALARAPADWWQRVRKHLLY
ncbi:MAG TPA: DUF1343 domain-containing protein [Planctomycetota bacterium]|nr:DUF1343 domain-containing protein [Planctomycetota bacterium]